MSYFLVRGKKLEEQLNDAEGLISCLDALIFLEKTNGKLSARWQFCEDELTKYKYKYKPTPKQEDE